MKRALRMGLALAVDLALLGLVAALHRLEGVWPEWPDTEDWP